MALTDAQKRAQARYVRFDGPSNRDCSKTRDMIVQCTQEGRKTVAEACAATGIGRTKYYELREAM